MQGYEKNYQLVAKRLKKCDLAEAAGRLGLPKPNHGAIRVSFLGSEYEINSEEVVCLDTKKKPNEKCLLIHYVTSKGAGEPAYEYCMIHHFANSSVIGGSPSWMNESFTRDYGNNKELVFQIMNVLGTDYIREDQTGCHIWQYRILPKIPMEILYYEADDEFPSELKLMFDKGAGRFLDFEQLAFLSGCLISRLCEIGKQIQQNKTKEGFN